MKASKNIYCSSQHYWVYTVLASFKAKLPKSTPQGSLIEKSYITFSESGNMQGEKLHWNHSKYALQAVDCMWHSYKFVGMRLCLFIIYITDNNWLPLKYKAH